jgi:hypothetical protein
MATTEASELDWNGVIARALAYLCLERSGLTEESLLVQAEFLQRFGLSRKEAATILGSTDDSLRVMANRREREAARKKAAGKGKSK